MEECLVIGINKLDRVAKHVLKDTTYIKFYISFSVNTLYVIQNVNDKLETKLTGETCSTK